MRALLPLLLLACPVGMGLMMWMMNRGNHGKQDQTDQAPPAAGPDPDTQAEIADLRAEVARLRHQPAPGRGERDPR